MEPKDSLPCSPKSATGLFSAIIVQSKPFPVYFEIHFNISLPSMSLSGGLKLSGFYTKTLYAFLFAPIRAICPANLTVLDLMTRISLYEAYKLWRSSLCSLLQSPVTSFRLAPNIFISTLFSNTLLPQWDTKFHTHINQQAKLCFCIYESWWTDILNTHSSARHCSAVIRGGGQSVCCQVSDEVSKPLSPVSHTEAIRYAWTREVYWAVSL
jgi:hypothetical protein